MDIILENALPIAALIIPAIISMRLEFVKKRKWLFAVIALVFNTALLFFLLYVGASLPEMLLLLLVTMLVSIA